jgi:transcriptional regulator with XRE-family HTH domain
MNNKELGIRIKWLRKNKGLYQEDLIKKLGLKISTIQSHEYGQWPNRKNLQKYIDFYGCDEVWLKTGHGVPYPDKNESAETAPIYNKVKEFEGRVLHVATPDQEYEPHGGWKPRPEMKTDINRMLGFTYQILSSESIYSNALGANINAFYGALVAEKDLKDTKNTLKIQADEIESLKDRVIALEKKADVDEKLKKS